MWDQIEPTGPHLSYLVLSTFLIVYALFSLFIRNRLHLSEPPLATLFGIVFGPRGINVIHPERWSLRDDVMLELTRVVASVQCFAIGLELPQGYVRGHWKSVGMLLGPVMVFGWLVCGLFVHLLFHVDAATALIIGACLTPTDPVLAASVLSGSTFSERIPQRIRTLLSVESGCNDGVSFPFLYVGIAVLTRATLGATLQKYFLVTILWQCLFGTLLGFFIGFIASRLLRFAGRKETIGSASYLTFYILLAFFAIGVASILGVDDFLVAFGAGVALSRTEISFWQHAEESQLPHVIDLGLNSLMFVFFGASIPWSMFARGDYPYYTVSRLLAFLVLVLLFRRIPAVLTLKPWIPDVRTWREALFAGHFGPMGVGALFLALEARAQLETDTSTPLPKPPTPPDASDPARQRAAEIIWPIICFVVLGSIMVHGLSTLVISISGHYMREKDERHPLIGAETERLYGMVDETSDDDGHA